MAVSLPAVLLAGVRGDRAFTPFRDSTGWRNGVVISLRLAQTSIHVHQVHETPWDEVR